MFRFTLKNIWAHKMRLALSMVAIFLGISFLVGTLVFTATIQKSFDDLFATAFKKTDAAIQSTKTTQNDFGEEERLTVPRSLLPEVQNVSGVHVAEGVIMTQTLVVLGNDGERIFASQGPPTMGFALPQSAELTQWNLVGKNGQNLSTQETVNTHLSDHEVLVDKATADGKDLKIGDTIKVVAPADVRTYSIKGYVRFGTADGLGGTATFLFNEKQATDITGLHDAYTQISVAADDGVSQKELANRISAELEKNHPGEFETITGKELTDQAQQDVKSFLNFFTIFLIVFAVIALIVSLIIIINSFAIIMTQRKREYALLRAIGATPGQIRRSVLGESIAVGIVASALGVAGGVGLALLIKAIMEYYGVKLPAGQLVIPPPAVVIGLIVGTVTTFVAAFFPAWMASRVPPIEALRETSFEKNRRMLYRIIVSVLFGAGALATIVAGYRAESDDRLKIVGVGIALMFLCVVFSLPMLIKPFTAIVGSRVVSVLLGISIVVFLPWFIDSMYISAVVFLIGIAIVAFGLRHSFGITGDIARRNNTRNPRRSARTALALLLGVALVVFITVFTSSAKTTFSNYLKQTYAADIIVGSFNEPPMSLTAERCAQIDAENYIDASSCLRSTNVYVWNDASDPRSSTTSQGVEALNTAELTKLFTLKYSGSPNSLGDKGIAITKQTADEKNVGLGDKLVLEGDLGHGEFTVNAVIKEGVLGPKDNAIVVDLQGLDRIQTERPSLVSMVVLKDGVKTADAVKQLKTLLKDTGIDVNDIKTSRDQQISAVNSVLAFVYGLLALAIIIASIGILNTMSLSILERRRELGLMRAVGTTKDQVRGFVRFESIILAVLGTTVGMLFGIGAGYVLVRALKEEGFTSFSVAPVSLILILAISCLIGVVAGAWPAWRATKVDILKAVTVE